MFFGPLGFFGLLQELHKALENLANTESCNVACAGEESHWSL